MARTQHVPNLIQGVSQQAVQQRRDSQCEAQFDCINSASEGCSARPPTEFVKLWAGRNWSSAFFTEIIREETGEHYLIAINGAVPQAINLNTGADCTVTNTAGDSYLSTGAPADYHKAIRAQTVEDTTFVSSRNAAVAMAGTLSPARVKEALVFVRAGAYGSTFKVELSGPAVLSASYTTPDGSTPSEADRVQTDYIAAQLTTGLDGLSGYSATRYGSTIRITRSDGADFEVSTSDGNGDEYLLAFKDKARSMAKLPARGVDGFMLEVAGESRTVNDNFWVKFNGGPATGLWEEVVAPSTKTSLNASTMPHLLVSTGANTFEWKLATWSTRIAGDEVTAKEPGFVGRKVRDVFWHAQRLGILYNSGASWSKLQNPYTYFPDTVQTVLATAPVDAKAVAGSAARGATTLDFTVQVGEGSYMWAQGVQYRIHTQNEVFKQDSVELPPSGAYEYSMYCDPLALGSYLYFLTEAGNYASMRALQFANGRVQGDTDVTAHIPKYIPAGARRIAAAETLRMVFVATLGKPDALFLYNYVFGPEQQYAQSAWNTWRLPGGTILWHGIKGDVMSLIVQRPEGVVLLRINLAPKLVDGIPGAGYRTRLDNRVRETMVTGLAYNSSTDRTSFTLPYTPTGPDVRVVIAEDKAGGYTRGRVFEVVSVVGAVVTVKGDLTGYKFYCGQKITAERTESQFFVRSDQGVLATDRLTVNKFGVEMSDSGYTRIEVSTPNKQDRIYEWEGRRLGTASSVTETPVLSNDTLPGSVSELAKNATIRVVNDSFLPSNWQTAFYEYEAVGLAGTK